MKHSVGWTDSADIYRELARKPALDAPWEIVAPQALCEAYVALCQATGIAANNPLLETVMDFTSPGTLRDQDLIRAVLRPLFDGSQEGLDNAIHAVDLARARALLNGNWVRGQAAHRILDDLHRLLYSVRVTK